MADRLDGAPLDLARINETVADRSDCFYWQADRRVAPHEAGIIWKTRHDAFSDDDIRRKANEVLTDEQIVYLEPLDLTTQGVGSVNSVRLATMSSGEEVVIRCHPVGIRNGYFHAEAAAAQLAKDAGLPAYSTRAIHDFTSGDDFAFQIAQRLPGTVLSLWLANNLAFDVHMASEMGKKMGAIHKIEVPGFGPFDNERARSGELTGLHTSFGSSVRAALTANVNCLVDAKLLAPHQVQAILYLFGDDNELLDRKQAVLVHNDIADWNVLTDGQSITALLDWDECVASHPTADIACWSLFFDTERLEPFLDGYWQVAPKSSDFGDMLALMRFRYALSKMALRVKRFSYDPSDFVKERIVSGNVHLTASLKHFAIA